MKKRFLALALGTLAFGVTLGGVKMSLGHQDALMVKAETQKAYKTLTFPDDKKTPISAYDKTWEAIIRSDSYTITNFNNNSWKDWTYIKCGRKGTTSIASIATAYAMDKSIAKVTVTFDKVTAGKVNSIKLVTASDATFENLVETVKLEDVSTGDKEFSLSKPALNLYYKIIFDCASGTANGFVQISKVSFFESDSSTPDPEPASPTKIISANLKDPNTVFYAGDKVTIDDFVIIATKEDGKTEELISGVTLKNDTLVEGNNTIEFEYTENGKTFNCSCQVPAIAKPFYTKLANISDLVVGKKILIASENGLKVLGANKGNNRAEVDATPTENKIEYNSNFAPLLVVPAKNGTFGLYDQNEDGLLYAGSSGNNYLKTTSDFSYVNENAFANISLNGTEWSIKFTGSNTRNLLRYNSNSKIFSCYGSGQGPISIYVSDEDPVAFDTEKWAKDFNDKLGVICDPTGETALTATKWNEAKKIFDDLSIPNKMAVKYGATDGVEMSKALKAYDFIIKTKYAALNDFLERREETRANALMLPGATDSTTWTLVGIGAVTIAASASLLFFRRKKSN